ERMLVRGEIAVGILIPPDFEQRVARRDRPPAQLLVDGAGPILRGAARRPPCVFAAGGHRILLGAARALRALPVRSDLAPAPSAGPDTFEVRAYFNPERRSPVFIVPGLCGPLLPLT